MINVLTVIFTLTLLAATVALAYVGVMVDERMFLPTAISGGVMWGLYITWIVGLLDD